MDPAPFNDNSTPRIAWIGLGNIGSIMAAKIVEKAPYTAPAIIYNRTKSVAEQFCRDKSAAKVAESVEECVQQADMIFTNVSNDEAVKGILEAALKAIPGGEKKLFVDLSTVHPNATDELAAMIQEAGHEFVACPVFGTPDVAEQARLVVALAGPKASVEKVRPFCKDIIAREGLLYPDQAPSIATTLKIIGNTFVLHIVEALAEGHVLAEKSGLGSRNLHALIDLMYPGPMAAYSNRLMSGDYFKTVRWGADLALKDYGHAKRLAQTFGVPVKGLDLAAEHVQDVSDWAAEEKGRKGDIAGVYGAVRLEAGLRFENGAYVCLTGSV